MIDKETVAENFKRWNDALKTCDPKKVAELYDDDDTFLPTMSPNFACGHGATEEYFEHFLKKHPSGKVISEKTQVFSDNAYLHSGIYDFTVYECSNCATVHARFTFVWVKNENNEWKIAHHHSSLLPKG